MKRTAIGVLCLSWSLTASAAFGQGLDPATAPEPAAKRMGVAHAYDQWTAELAESIEAKFTPAKLQPGLLRTTLISSKLGGGVELEYQRFESVERALAVLQLTPGLEAFPSPSPKRVVARLYGRTIYRATVPVDSPMTRDEARYLVDRLLWHQPPGEDSYGFSLLLTDWDGGLEVVALGWGSTALAALVEAPPSHAEVSTSVENILLTVTVAAPQASGARAGGVAGGGAAGSARSERGMRDVVEGAGPR